MNVKFYLLGLIAGSLSLTNCSKEELTEGGTNSFSEEYTATFASGEIGENNTRTAFDEKTQTIHFKDQENLTSFVWDENNKEATVSNPATRVAGTPATVTVKYAADPASTKHNFLFVHPYLTKTVGEVEQLTMHLNADHTQLTNVRLAKNQYPKDQLYDVNQDLVISTQQTLDANTSSENTLKPVYFTRVFAFLRFEIDASKIQGMDPSGKITNVEFTAPEGTKLTSRNLNVDLSTYEPILSESFSAVNASYTPSRAFVNNKASICFVVNPIKINGPIKIVIKTDKQVITETRDVNWDLLRNRINTTEFGKGTVDIKDQTAPVESNYFTKGVTINGQEYSGKMTDTNLNKVSHFTKNTKDTKIRAGKYNVFFIDPDAPAISNLHDIGVSNKIVLIGNDPSSKTDLKFINYWGLKKASTAEIYFKNMRVDLTGIPTNYAFNMQDATEAAGAKVLCFEDCEIICDKTLLTAYKCSNNACVEQIIFRNCKISYTGSKNFQLITLTHASATSPNYAGFKGITFSNNIIYATQTTLNKDNKTAPLNVSLFFQPIENEDLTNFVITCTDNTFVNFCGYGSGADNNNHRIVAGLFTIKSFGSATIQNNLAYCDTEVGQYAAFMAVSNNYAGAWPSVTESNNHGWMTAPCRWKLFSEANVMHKPENIKNNVLYPEKDIANPFLTYDLVNGKFIKAAGITTGSTLE